MSEPEARLAEIPFTVELRGGRPGWSCRATAPSAVEIVRHGEGDRDFARLRAMLGRRRPRDPEGPPFQGGVIGLVSYEFGDRLDGRALKRDTRWPDLVLMRFEEVAALPDQPAAKAHEARPRADIALVESEPSGAAYEAAVAATVRRIRAGDLYQANLARAWSGRLNEGDAPFAAFERLAAKSPAPFAAYLRLPDLALVSQSPERFLSIDGDGVTVRTEPIKGTRPRGATPGEDAALAAALAASPKDRAENLMIVDLMRHDLARVCDPGSVSVEELCALRSFPAVHHLVSRVRGRLRAGADAADLLAAAFPPGSVTGAPKLAAMAEIAAREPFARGPWCGTLFWAGFDGAFDSSVLIRTACLAADERGWRWRVLAGAGIVADSDPAAERRETETKVAPLLRALAGE